MLGYHYKGMNKNTKYWKPESRKYPATLFNLRDYSHCAPDNSKVRKERQLINISLSEDELVKAITPQTIL